VYEARDERLGNSVALKQNFHGGDEKLKLAFEREARLPANLRHPALPVSSCEDLQDRNVLFFVSLANNIPNGW